MTPEQEAAYALRYSLSRTDLKPEVQAEYDRLLAERRADRSYDADLTPSDEPPHRFDVAGKWLANRYQLTSRDRDLVKAATAGGAAVSDPRLQEAVSGLASAVLEKRLPMPTIVFDYIVGGLGSIPPLAFALMSVLLDGHHLILPILAAVAVAPVVITHFIARPRRRRQLVAKVLRVHSGCEELPEP
ncbi:MAG TPA: hypothetical protein VJT16_13990 [Streptosporangiaceae bacterium]|nr:hypothetical protein [Streptosporangiaceae bacterium]